jgi:putative phage-type endonuclease
MATVHTMDQRTAEWFAARLGKVTASKVADVVARTKTGWGASRANYKAQLVCERLTGCAEVGYTNAAMQHGIDTEPEARAAYCFRQDVDVLEVGFVDHPRIAMSGASPDGLIGGNGLLEVKCPQTATHIETLLGQSVPTKYLHQIQWQLACTERDWCDFVSFDPRLPATMQMFVQRIHRDDDLIGSLEKDVSDFLAEVDETVARLREQYEREAA